ncbi:MAG: hypothetical protein ABSF00_08650 [Candidatus Bathyarchaeia archaeon]
MVQKNVSIYTSGRKTWIAAGFPREWAESWQKICQREANEDEKEKVRFIVRFTSLGRELAFLSPFPARSAEATLQCSDITQAEFGLISGYLNGCRKLMLNFPDNEEGKYLEALNRWRRKLPGTNLGRRKHEKNGVQQVVEFEVPTKTISEILEDLHAQYFGIRDRVQRAFTEASTLPINASILKETYGAVQEQEDVADSLVFQGKRLLTSALDNPEILHSAGISGLRETVPNTVLLHNMERIIDLHTECLEGLINLNKSIEADAVSKKKLASPSKLMLSKAKYGFPQFLVDIQKFVDKAWEGLRIPIIALSVVRTRHDCFTHPVFGRVAFRGDDITQSNREAIIALVIGSTAYQTQLGWLQGKMWAMTGHAINLAEAALNLLEPEKIGQPLQK